ncbi:hypothetical protein DL93DRAFT_1669572 [Clavulina sp. PMI_390]|nr:hypothetical protein DL93DRAFT_1669572 [Clavulina sp. PMI_390]
MVLESVLSSFVQRVTTLYLEDFPPWEWMPVSLFKSSSLREVQFQLPSRLVAGRNRFCPPLFYAGAPQHLQTLIFCGSNDCLTSLDSSNLHSLQKLKLTDAIPLQNAWEALSHCLHLVSLSWACSIPSDEENIEDHFPALFGFQDLSLLHLQSLELEDDGSCSLFFGNVNAPSVRRLTLLGPTLSRIREIMEKIDHPSQIRRLDICEVRDFGEADVTTIFTLCPLLEDLRVDSWTSSSLNALSALAEHREVDNECVWPCPSLRHLGLNFNSTVAERDSDTDLRKSMERILLHILERLAKTRASGPQSLLRISIENIKIELPSKNNATESIWSAVQVIDPPGDDD